MPNNALKEIASSPWLRIVNLLMTALVGLFLYFIVEAKDDLRVDIDKNETNIIQMEQNVKQIELDQMENTTILKVIKETLDEVRLDVKHLREEK